MANQPTGTVTLNFTDIEGSAERWARDRAATAAAVTRNNSRPGEASHFGAFRVWNVGKVIGEAAP